MYVATGVHVHAALSQFSAYHEPVRQQGLAHQYCPDGGMRGPTKRGGPTLS